MDTAFAFFYGLVLIAIAVMIYFVPLLVARERHHPQILAIGVLNVCAGWTGVLWVVALVWACTTTQQVQVMPPPSHVEPPHPLVFPRRPIRSRV